MRYCTKLVILILMFSCNNSKPITLFEKIKIRVFNFGTNKYEILDSEKKLIKTNDDFIYIYDFDKHKDTLKFIKDEAFFKGQTLKVIDAKNVNIAGVSYSVSKCLFENEKDFRTDRYLYVSKKLGFIFIQNLFTGNMYEYDIKKHHKIHKEIALNKLKFKSGDFEIKHSKMEYKELKE